LPVGPFSVRGGVAQGEWIPRNNKSIVLVQHALVHHYSFFVQQEWLDRTSLLEDIRASNLPGTQSILPGIIARWKRISAQILSILKRKLVKTSS